MVKGLQRNNNLLKALGSSFIFCVFLLMLNRVQYGIEFTDESWYIAEPYAVAELGAVPFVNNVSQSPGFTVPLALAFKLYVWINGSTVGLVLFSRVLYLCVHFVLTLLTVRIVNSYTAFKIPLVAVGALLFINHCHSLYDVNYNTVGMMYFPLIMALVFAENGDNSWRSFKWGILAGIVAVRTVMGTPQTIVGLLTILCYLCVKRKRMRIAGIMTGAIFTCMIIFGSVVWGYGHQAFYTWFLLFFQQVYFSIEIQKDWTRIFNFLLWFFRPVALLTIVICVLRRVLKNYLIEFEVLWRGVLAGSILIGCLISIYKTDYVGYYLMCHTWALPYFYWYYMERKDQMLDVIIMICMAYLCIFFFAAFTDVYGFSGRRAYWNYVPLVSILCLLARDAYGFSLQKAWGHWFLAVLCLICTVGIVGWGWWKNYSYVYRDKPIPSLSAKVEDGIWKGLYTTENRAKNVVLLEHYLNSVTEADDKVLCLDWVSFGYLMINGSMCSPTTLDASAYSYKTNNPKPYYLYFQAEKCVPDKIIYIDYGRDKHLSIDDGEWEFNELVWRHYHFTSAYRNELFYVRVYILDDREGSLRLGEEQLKKVQHEH